MLKGSLVALVTPMHVDGSIDKKSLHELVEWHIAEKTDGFVIAGTTGEGSTLTENEQYEVISAVVLQVAKRLPVIAGTGTLSTEHTIHLTRNAHKAGADGALIVTPYYNKPTQKGLFAHYQAIAKSVDFPIIMYNVPGRTACDMLPETVERLAKISNIVGIKEATGKPERTAEIFKRCGKEFAIYSGDDATALDSMQKGAIGAISVTANVLPQKMHNMCQAALNGEMETAEKINQELMPLHKKLFLESNPIPTKWVLNQMGLIPAGIRLPLSPLDTQYHSDLQDAMQMAGVTHKTKV
ncbi:MAG TPA: 4-hydroxy-tetrahydrodipicolinate synthase [Gammaproteobacteria bacterium]|nr:4-hydroxy-tetrahydrodipicolinate synthase [Gammaproteobacteria bacterium]